MDVPVLVVAQSSVAAKTVAEKLVRLAEENDIRN